MTIDADYFGSKNFEMFAWMLDHVAQFTTCRESAFLLRAAKWCSESNDLRLRTTLDAREEEIHELREELDRISIDSDGQWIDRHSRIQAEREREFRLEAWLLRRSTVSTVEELAELYHRGEL